MLVTVQCSHTDNFHTWLYRAGFDEKFDSAFVGSQNIFFSHSNAILQNTIKISLDSNTRENILKQKLRILSLRKHVRSVRRNKPGALTWQKMNGGIKR